ncbi:MAG: RHS repeat-associated core domain-containing protein, partial [Chlamydiota bacterium]
MLSQEREILSEERFTYNTFRLVDHTNTLGLKTIYHYDKAGRLIREETEEREKSYAYDSLGFLERTSDGAATHVEIHDVMGRVIQEWTEDNVGRIENKTTYTYENNRKKTAQRETSQGEALDQFFYDSEGRLERHIDPKNHVSQFIYKEIVNDLGQKVWTKKIIDPKGNATLETYDVAGKVVRLQHLNKKEETVAQEIIFYDRAGNKAKSLHTVYEKASPIKIITITWCYDSMGRLIQEIEAGQKTTAYRHFIEEHKEEKTLPNGTILTTLFDGLGRPIELKSSDSSIHYSYTYSADHLEEKIQDLVHDRFFERHYNSFHELTYESGASWHYDAVGCCKEFHLPHGGTIRYSYEGMHLVSVERFSKEGKLLYTHQYTEFDPNGHVHQEELIGNLGTIVTSHDLLERPSSQSSPWLTHVTHYGPSGLVTQTENSLFAPKDYEHDPINQITREGEVDYSFDSLGNPTSCETNDYNQILTGPDYALKYDFNGNPYEKTTAEATIRYDYDALGRLTEISSAEKTILYQYDPFSRLYSKEVVTPSNSTTIYYIYDKDREIGTIDENGKLLELKVLGLGLKGDIGAAIAIELEDEIFAPLHDFRGNVIALLSLDGKIVESSDFDAFGREDKPLNTYRNPWRFSSKRTEETGLIFFGFRFYDPILQRFLTPDPSGFTDGPNLYAYTRNNPLSRLDLFGLDSEFLVPLRVEVPFEQFTSALKMPIPILPCRYVLSDQTVEGFVSCGAFYKLQFAPTDETPKVIDILEHMHLLVAPEGSQISAGSLGNGINVGLNNLHKMFVSTTSKIEEGTLMFAVHNRSKGFFRDVCRLIRELFFGKETRVIRAMQQIITGISERVSAI